MGVLVAKAPFTMVAGGFSHSKYSCVFSGYTFSAFIGGAILDNVEFSS